MEEVSVPPNVRLELSELLRNNFLLSSALFEGFPVQDADYLVEVLHRFYALHDQEGMFLKTAVEREIRKTKEIANLLRLNTLATKLLTRMCRKGKSTQTYLRALLQKAVARTISSNQDLELDPAILKERRHGDVEAAVGDNMRKIDLALRELMDDVFGSISLVPREIRDLCGLMRDLTVECLSPVLAKSKRGEYVCVCSFFFLRFVCPAMVSPHAFGLVKDPAPRDAARTLLMFSKFTTHLANVTSFTEEWMGPLNALLIEYQPRMLSFLQQLCAPSPILCAPTKPLTTSQSSPTVANSSSSLPTASSPLSTATGDSNSHSFNPTTPTNLAASGTALPPSLSISQTLHSSGGGTSSRGGSGSGEAALTKKSEQHRPVDLLARAFRMYRARVEAAVAESKNEDKFTAAESTKIRMLLAQLYLLVGAYPEELVDLKGFPEEDAPKETSHKEKDKEKEKEKDKDKEKEKEKEKEKDPPAKKSENRKSRLLELLSLGIHKDKEIDRESSASPPAGTAATTGYSSLGDSSDSRSVGRIGVASPATSSGASTPPTQSSDLRSSRDGKKDKKVNPKERPPVSSPLVPKFPTTIKAVSRACIDDAEVLAWAAGLADRPDDELRRAGELISVLIDEVRLLRGERHTHFRLSANPLSPRVSPHPGAGANEPDRGRKALRGDGEASPRGGSAGPHSAAIVNRERSGAESRIAESKVSQAVIPRRHSGTRLDLSPMMTRPTPTEGLVSTSPMATTSPARTSTFATTNLRSSTGIVRSNTPPPSTPSPPIAEVVPTTTPPLASSMGISVAKLKAISSMSKFKIEKRSSPASPITPASPASGSTDGLLVTVASIAAPTAAQGEYNPFTSPRAPGNPFTTPRTRPMSMNGIDEKRNSGDGGSRTGSYGRPSDPSPVAVAAITPNADAPNQ